MNKININFTLLLLIVFNFIATIGCSGKKELTKIPPEIFNKWRHSHEENVGNIDVFRPATFRFPPSRGRLGFEIKPNGEIILHDIAAADGIAIKTGRWTFIPPDSIVTDFSPNTARKFHFKIVSCTREMLKIKR